MRGSRVRSLGDWGVYVDDMVVFGGCVCRSLCGCDDECGGLWSVFSRYVVFWYAMWSSF